MWLFIILQFSLRTNFKAENVREILSSFVNVTFRIKDNRPIGNFKWSIISVIKVFTDFKGSREKITVW